MASPLMKSLFWHGIIALVVLALFKGCGDGAFALRLVLFFLASLPLRLTNRRAKGRAKGRGRIWTILGKQIFAFLVFISTFYGLTHIFLAQNETALFLALGVMVVLGQHLAAIGKALRADPVFAVLATIGAGALTMAIWYTAFYVNPALFADEWRHANAYFFNLDLIQSLIKRKNGHLMVFPNGILQANFFMFCGSEYVLAILNIALLLLSGHIASVGLFMGRQVGAAKRWAIGFLLIGVLFWFVGYSSLFWGLGVHNNLGVLGGILTAYLIAYKTDFQSLGRKSSARIMAKVYASIYLGAASFSAAATSWFLPAMGAWVKKANPRQIFLQLGLGFSGFMLTLGFFVLRKPPRGGFDVLGLIKAEFGLLGQPIVRAFYPTTTGEDLPLGMAIGFGVFGVFWFCLLSLQILRARRREGFLAGVKFQTLVFAWLLMVFAIGALALIAFGRVGSLANPMAVITPRYVPWALVFWLGLVLWVFDFILAQKRSVFQNGALVGTIAALSIALWLSNISIAKSFIAYSQNYKQRRGLDIVLNQHKDQLFGTVYHTSKTALVLKVTQVLKQNRLNIFAQSWPHIRDLDLQNIADRTSDKCVGQFETYPYENANGQVVQGWAWPSRGQGVLETLIFVGPDMGLVGMARPSFAHIQTENNTAAQYQPSALRAVQMVLPFVSYLPGPSGRFDGLIAAPQNPPYKTPLKTLTVYGQSRGGKWCKIVSPPNTGKKG